jgi:hypothetical protein
MARAKWTKSSRKPHYCGRGHEIPVGEGYYSAAPGFRGRTLYRCKDHPFRPSELTVGLRAEPLSALEALEDTVPTLEVGDYDGLRSAVEEFASAVRDYADQRQEALDAWENGNSMLEDLQYTAESAADEAEQIEADIEEFDGEEPDRAEFDDDEDGQAEYDDALDEYNTEREGHWEEQTTTVLDAAASIEF